MDLMERMHFAWNPLGFIGNVVEREWQIGDSLSEKECEDRLYRFLHDRLPNLQIVNQYGRGRSHVDLMVQDKVMIELKYKLTSTSEFQRLLGQVMDYKDWGRQLLLVFVGEVEPSLLKEIRKRLNEQFSQTWRTDLEEAYRIVQK
jgi:hypothetical protein